jgi:hypothetical protein
MMRYAPPLRNFPNQISQTCNFLKRPPKILTIVQILYGALKVNLVDDNLPDPLKTSEKIISLVHVGSNVTHTARSRALKHKGAVLKFIGASNIACFTSIGCEGFSIREIVRYVLVSAMECLDFTLGTLNLFMRFTPGNIYVISFLDAIGNS